jgi:hypothetical protein
MMELDIFIPSLSLAFEYQGEQHYRNNAIIGNFEASQIRDQEKQAKCRQFGITLLHIPYWWKKDKEYLEELVHLHRPDLLHASVSLSIGHLHVPISTSNESSKTYQ